MVTKKKFSQFYLTNMVYPALSFWLPNLNFLFFIFTFPVLFWLRSVFFSILNHFRFKCLLTVLSKVHRKMCVEIQQNNKKVQGICSTVILLTFNWNLPIGKSEKGIVLIPQDWNSSSNYLKEEISFLAWKFTEEKSF